jgi:isopentenyl diphosphate isomerase/L-lactate dehydrogenase-like FMN-dependent dehydrogenase
MKFKLTKIEKIDVVEYFGTLHDLTVKDNHSYVVENTIVHNSACLTRKNSGIGRGSLSSILDCSQFYSEGMAKIVADGGIKTNGHICVALAAGAHLVMLGSKFTACGGTAADLPINTLLIMEYLYGLFLLSG